MTLITSPATIALTEFRRGGADTSHYRNPRDLIQRLLRNRDYIQLVLEELPAAKEVWDQEAREDAEREKKASQPLPHEENCDCYKCQMYSEWG